MRPGLLTAMLFVLTACEQYDTVDGVFQPATVIDAGAPQATLTPVTTPDAEDEDADADTDEDDGEDDEGDGEAEADDAEAEADEAPGGGDELSAFLDALDDDEPIVEAVEEPPVEQPVAAVAPMPARLDLSPSGWGVRLVSTIPASQPPRAILGMADGREIVVRPGDLVPEARVVVMAVGASTVEIAEVTPAGDSAEIRSRTLTVQYPSGPAPVAEPR